MSWRRRANSFRFAFQGLADLLRSQPNARIHLLAVAVVVAAGLYFRMSRTEWSVLAVGMALVIALEAMNTAMEYLTDLLSPDFHPLAGKAKDVAAAAVLVAALGAAAAGLVIFGPRIWALWFGQ